MDTEATGLPLTLTPASEPEIQSLAPGGGLTGRSIDRSCYSCNSKKIKCDKKQPCLPCGRAGRSCNYPPAGPRKRRAKKTIMADMASRIASLEKSLAQARAESMSVSAGSTSEVDASPSTSSATIVETQRNLDQRPREDILVQTGSLGQYVNEILLSRVLEEQRNVGCILTPPENGASHLPMLSPFNALGILSAPYPSIVPANLQPPKSVAVRLWNIYVDNVEGCSGLKFLHLPTHEVKVYSVIDDPTAAPLENLSLTFAIYFAATLSLDDRQLSTILEQDRHTSLARFKLGLEQAFAHSDFLDHPTVTGLHALAIYLSALRVHNRSKGLWVLNGLAIRIAQALGLHMNGERLGLSPFQSEIRRRLWWHLLSRDGRAGEDYGLENIQTPLQMSTSDVNLPLNVDDADLYPEMKSLPEERKGWTPMTFSLIVIELFKAMRDLTNLARPISSNSSPASSSTPLSSIETARAKFISDLKSRVTSTWLQYCNPVIPQQRLTLICSHFLLNKLEFVTRLQFTLFQHPGKSLAGDNDSSSSSSGSSTKQKQRQKQKAKQAPILEFTTESNLLEALSLLETKIGADNSDGLLQQFSWAAKAYPQYHVTMYVLWHLCIKPEGPSVERAWSAVQMVFDGAEELWDNHGDRGSNESRDVIMRVSAAGGGGCKSAVLKALKQRALAVRERLEGYRLRRSPVQKRRRDGEMRSDASAASRASERVVDRNSESTMIGVGDGMVQATTDVQVDGAATAPAPPSLNDSSCTGAVDFLHDASYQVDDNFDFDFNLDFDADTDQWLNWTTLVQGFQLDGFGVGNGV